MSRGPGHLERALRALFDASPDLAFVTVELVEHCFPDIAEKDIRRKHVNHAATMIRLYRPDARCDRPRGTRDNFLNFGRHHRARGGGS